MKATKKPVTIEFFTFDEIVEIGKKNNPESIHGDRAWNFEFKGVQITHENDECYIIPTLEGNHFFTPKDVLICGVKGELYPCKKDIFELTYDIQPENETFLHRIKKEYEDLELKAEKLENSLFKNGDTNVEFFNKVGALQYNLLITQLCIMQSYIAILICRIENLHESVTTK